MHQLVAWPLRAQPTGAKRGGVALPGWQRRLLVLSGERALGGGRVTDWGSQGVAAIAEKQAGRQPRMSRGGSGLLQAQVPCKQMVLATLALMRTHVGQYGIGAQGQAGVAAGVLPP